MQSDSTPDRPLCACGCGGALSPQQVKRGTRYLPKHHLRKTMLTCRKCRRVLPRSEFRTRYGEKGQTVGVDGHCMSCRAQLVERAERLAAITIPSGFCECGCGQRTKVTWYTSPKRGCKAGFPQRFVSGHNPKTIPPTYEVDAGTGCWNWTGRCDKRGYGRMAKIGGESLAHRIMYERVKGPIPDGLVLHHVCCNTRCVNPDHLQPVTDAENIRAGRATKLTPDEVAEIRRLAGQESNAALGRRFGISVTAVRSIVHNRSWQAPRLRKVS